MIRIVSFGYKHGVPADVDCVVDCRSLRNPYGQMDLRPLTGRDPRVRAFLEADPRWSQVLADAERGVTTECVLAVGCHGGTHRAPAVAEALAERLRQAGLAVEVEHRQLPPLQGAG